MFSLVYRSVAKPDFNLQRIEEMLAQAKMNNHRLGITGCLLYYDGEFIQYLEGNQFRVLTLFDKIKADPRHKDVELLSYGEREGRAFASWDMAFENFYGENDQITHLRLVVGEYLNHNQVPIADNPSKAVFWQTVGNLLNQNTSRKI